MSVVAGIILGVVNENWLARIIAPFGWGMIWCVYQWILKDKLQAYVRNAGERGVKPKWGMSYTQAFYFIEYLTAAFTSLLFSITSGLARDFLF